MYCITSCQESLLPHPSHSIFAILLGMVDLLYLHGALYNAFIATDYYQLRLSPKSNQTSDYDS